MKKYTCLLIWGAVIITFCGVCRPTSAIASDGVVLKISHQWSTSDFRDRLAHKFASEVEKQTNGALKFQIYPGTSLVKPQQEFDALSNDSLDMAIYVLAYSGGKLPATDITVMPGLITSYKQAYDWRKAAIGKWLEKYLEDHGVKIITWIWQTGGVVSNSKPVIVPSDIKGMKTRAPGKPLSLLMQAAGASIATFPSDETYDALRSGVVDSLWTVSASLMSFRLEEVSKYVTTPQDHTFWYIFTPMLMSEATYNKLTPAQQKIVVAVGDSLSEFALKSSLEDDDKLAKEFAAAGVKVSTMNERQAAEWSALARKDVYKSFAERVDGGQKLLDMAETVK